MTTLSIINESKQIYLSSVENELNTTLENGDYKSKIRFTIPYLVTTNDNTLYQTIKVLNATIPYSFYIINEYNCNLNISKLSIKNVCGVSEVTINKCFKKLDTLKDVLIPKCILDKYV